MSGYCRCRWPAAFPGGGSLLVALALSARMASMLVHACHLVLSSLCTRLGASCSFHGFACWGGCSWWLFAQLQTLSGFLLEVVSEPGFFSGPGTFLGMSKSDTRNETHK